MSQIVAYECGFIDAMRLLRLGEYVSPYVTLEKTVFTILDNEVESYYRGCADAVIEHKGMKP